MFGRKKIAMIVAEFLGTGILSFVVLAVSKSNLGLPYFVSIAAGLVVAAVTLALSAVSGAHLNPAITVGLWTARKVKTLPAIIYIAAQLLGAGAAYLLFSYMVGQHWSNAGTFQSKILVGEVVGTFIFSLGWAAASFQKLPLGQSAGVIGMSLTLGIMAASTASAGFLNPAVALGARSWVWGTYILGPIIGSVVGFNLYSLLFAPVASLLSEKETTSTKKKK